MSVEKKNRDYESILRKAGYKVTRPRKIILQILAERDDHPDATAIFRRAVRFDDSISLSTIYRTMKILEDIGAIHRHAFDGGPSRFEKAGRSHHDHLIDIDSGQIVEFSSQEIEEMQDRVARSLGYEIVHHRLELYGRKIRT